MMNAAQRETDSLPPNGSPVVEMRGVSIAFDGPPIFEDVSFAVAPGETRVLLGPAGIGKSVLL